MSERINWTTDDYKEPIEAVLAFCLDAVDQESRAKSYDEYDSFQDREYVSDEEFQLWYDETGKYYDENILKLQQLIHLLHWLLD